MRSFLECNCCNSLMVMEYERVIIKKIQELSNFKMLPYDVYQHFLVFEREYPKKIQLLYSQIENLK